MVIDWRSQRNEITMQIVPPRPPGRSDRKAGAYTSEILRLRALGYTFEAIREGLNIAGIQVSESALRREVKRSLRLSLTQDRACRSPISTTPPSWPGQQPSSADAPLPCAADDPKGEPTALKDLTSHEIAEAFFLAHSSNPLFNVKESP